MVALVIGAAALAFTRGDASAAMSQPMTSASAAPAPLRQPGHTVLLSTTDQARFTPDSVTVRAGDTVAFVVTNAGPVAHDFVVGDESVQQAHERQMADGALDEMAGAASIELPSATTTTLVYTFDRPGTLLFACHVPGHYADGMVGSITVTSS